MPEREQISGNQNEQIQPQPFEFKDSESIEEYLEWKHSIPLEFRRIIESKLKNTAPNPPSTGYPLTDQFLNDFAKAIQSGTLDASSVDPRIADLIMPLSRIETRGGYLNVFETLSNPNVSWKLRTNIYETQIRPILEWLVDQDLESAQKKIQEDSQKEEKQQAEEQNDLPPSNEDVRSSMEQGMEKREGEAKAIFSVAPFYGGYYRQLVFNSFRKDLQWAKSQNEFLEPKVEAIDPLSIRVLSGKIRGQSPLSLPLPYDWLPNPNTIETDAPLEKVELQQNQDGLWYLAIQAEGVFSYRLTIGQRQYIESIKRFQDSSIEGDIPDELTKMIKELRKQGLPKLKLKREIVKLVRNHLTYSNDPQAYAQYVSDSSQYFKKVWANKAADCFVANTLALRALAEVDSQSRFISGYFVREKGQSGQAVMHSGNGHAWLEIWDQGSQRVIRLDATPKGDPTIDEDQQEKDLEGEPEEGDYGQEEIMGEKEAQEKIKELKKQEKSNTKKETKGPSLIEQQFAELAECTPAQAKEFIDALERVRKIVDERGISISDLLKNEWQKIIEERKIEKREYKGPVRMDEGSRLEDPVEATIDIRSREFNPTGFEKDETQEKLEADFGGICIYFSFDLSGSMAQPDAATGRSKADVQRDAALLFVDSLMQSSYSTRQHGQDSDLLPLKIMVTLASETGQISLPLTDRWAPKEQWAMYSALVRTARGGTPTHQTLQLIEKDFDKEVAQIKKMNIPLEKQPLHYIVEVSDGSPDDFATTEAMHVKLKAKGAVIRSYPIGGASASADAAEPLTSFSELPKIMARDIIDKFQKIRPKKIRS